MILISFGTRPEYIKIKPLLDKFSESSYSLLFTGQHIDLLGHIEEDIERLEIVDGSNRLDSIVSSIMNKDEIFTDIDSVLVQGDTTSAFAIALAAFHRKIKIIHLEAGLRTYDKEQPYPEEFNRQTISRMADIHLCPTELTAQNLRSEGLFENIHVVGNTVLDNLRNTLAYYTDKVVVTMHRRENHEKLDQWFTEINKLAKRYQELEFIIPLHPNPNVQKHKHLLTDLTVVPPMGYEEFIDLLAYSRLVITDSGGLQEESSFLNKKCIVCREKTERIESVGSFSFICASPENLSSIFDDLVEDYRPQGICPYGDGHAAEKIFEVLKNEIQGRLF